MCKFYDLDYQEKSAALTLPEGWYWHDYMDGSGALRFNDGNAYFAYDLGSYNGLFIEYEVDTSSSLLQWGLFEGSLDEFKQFAERMIDKWLL